MDKLDILPGEDFRQAIQRALTECHRMLVVLSPDFVDSEEAQAEVNFAILKRKQIFPILHRQCDLPYRLSTLQYIDFTGSYPEALGELRTSLSRTSNSPGGLIDAQGTAGRRPEKLDVPPPDKPTPVSGISGRTLGVIALGIGLALALVLYFSMSGTNKQTPTVQTPPQQGNAQRITPAQSSQTETGSPRALPLSIQKPRCRSATAARAQS
jgi:TIR domain